MIRDNAMPYDLASLIRGLYARVATRAGVDPSYVSRVARGERQSQTIEAALGKEMKRILSLSGAGRNGNGNGRHRANGNGTRAHKRAAHK
jgi:hypothetical protein